jgi:hypothetical protein
VKEQWLLLRGEDRSLKVAKISTYLNTLPLGVNWKVEVTKHTRRRSDAQNAYLWGVVYPTILAQGPMQGWAAEDLHEFFLGEHFGWKTLEFGPVKRTKPNRRSSQLSTSEFLEYVAYIQQRMAELSVYVPDPNEAVSEPTQRSPRPAMSDPATGNL